MDFFRFRNDLGLGAEVVRTADNQAGIRKERNNP